MTHGSQRPIPAHYWSYLVPQRRIASLCSYQATDWLFNRKISTQKWFISILDQIHQLARRHDRAAVL